MQNSKPGLTWCSNHDLRTHPFVKVLHGRSVLVLLPSQTIFVPIKSRASLLGEQVVNRNSWLYHTENWYKRMIISRLVPKVCFVWHCDRRHHGQDPSHEVAAPQWSHEIDGSIMPRKNITRTKMDTIYATLCNLDHVTACSSYHSQNSQSSGWWYDNWIAWRLNKFPESGSLGTFVHSECGVKAHNTTQ